MDLPRRKPCCRGRIQSLRWPSHRLRAAEATMRLSQFTMLSGRVLLTVYALIPSAVDVVLFLGRQTSVLWLYWCPVVLVSASWYAVLRWCGASVVPRQVVTSYKMEVPRGPKARQALKGIPSGPGEELPLWRMACSISLRRTRQSLSCVGSGLRIFGGRPMGPSAGFGWGCGDCWLWRSS